MYANQLLSSNKQNKMVPKVFFKRLWYNAIFGSTIMLICLLISVIGYKITMAQFDWCDSLLNATRILSGMGPMIDANIVLTKEAKVFASLYALFSGVAFISTIGILIAPIAHRFFHRLHLEDNL